MLGYAKKFNEQLNQKLTTTNNWVLRMLNSNL